ncbi:GmrSD restriction endonuclease domain-containing protein [Salinibacter ruber]|uniref:GmrSD restriction endonuclease domain-containing protein n=1 Tax=Salinibacter ruber TaxID=146919 RepID=UPI00216A8EC3|nr:DUF262 domain-containing protein [Salinibacter ruber]MCS4142158.1 hypothetical protein [Salinibacter ruber]
MADSVRSLLAKIKNREIVLPEFQREFTWKRSQSRDLVDSLLEGYPIGSLLLWKTGDVPALKNMPNFDPDGRVEVLLDGQQRLTALYMLTKDAVPPYYSPADISGGHDPRELHYNLQTQELRYYQKTEMQNNPRWVSVVDCLQDGDVDPQAITKEVAETEGVDQFELYGLLNDNYNALRGVQEIDLPIMHVEEDATLNHALTVFERVNKNGTPLSEADIALAHMCSKWPDTRWVFKEKLAEMEGQGFEFGLTFLIRGMNAVVNGRAEYHVLHGTPEQELIAGWNSLETLLEYLINFLRDRAYVYSTDDLNTTNVLIPMLGYLAQNKEAFQDERAREGLLYWMYAALYQRRYSGSVDTMLEKDLGALEDRQPIESLIAQLREDEGSPEVNPSHLDTRGVSHPLYNMMQILIRKKGGVDWSNGLKLSEPMGSSYSIEKHHIFPKSVLEKVGFDTGENLIDRKRVHEIANRVPLTKEGNQDIFDAPPSEYLPKVEEANPGNLERFMIPMDEKTWTLESYEEFLAQRRGLIARSINQFMEDLREDSRPLEDSAASKKKSPAALLRHGESETLEFKSTLRWHVYAERMDREIEHASLKTIAAFLNTGGGVLLVGVNDDGEPRGLEEDQFDSHDDMMLHLTNIVKERIGTSFMRFLNLSVEEVEGSEVLRVGCEPSVVPAYLDHQNEEHFYIRTGPSTSELPPSEIHDYIRNHFYGEAASGKASTS